MRRWTSEDKSRDWNLPFRRCLEVPSPTSRGKDRCRAASWRVRSWTSCRNSCSPVPRHSCSSGTYARSRTASRWPIAKSISRKSRVVFFRNIRELTQVMPCFDRAPCRWRWRRSGKRSSPRWSAWCSTRCRTGPTRRGSWGICRPRHRCRTGTTGSPIQNACGIKPCLITLILKISISSRGILRSSFPTSLQFCSGEHFAFRTMVITMLKLSCKS